MSANGKVKQLGEVADFINGRAFKTSEWSNVGLPIIRIQNLNDANASFNYFDGEYDPKHYVSKGDLLFSWSGSLGTSFGAFIWDREPGLLNQHIFNVRIKDLALSQDYLYLFFNHVISEIESKAHGAAGLVHVTKQELSKFEIRIPDLKTQQTIVDQLNSVTNSVVLIDQIISTSQELFESVLNRAIEDNSFGESYSLGDLFTLEYGKGLPAKERIDGPIPVYGSNGKIGTHISSLASGPGIIIGRKGSIGKVIWSEEDFWPIDTTYYVNLIQPNDLKFIFYLLSTLQLESLNKASGVPGLNRNDVYKLEIQLPEINTQLEIVKQLDEIFAYIQDLYKLKQLHQELYISYLAKALSVDGAKNSAKNNSFAIQQAVAALLNTGFKRGEMAIAKVLYLIQEVYNLNLGIQFSKHNFGPYDSAVRKAITSGQSSTNKFFSKAGVDRQYFILGPNGAKILKYKVATDTEAVLMNLLPLINDADSASLERLATVCKIIQDENTIDPETIRNKVDQWKPNKYSPAQINKTLDFIVKQDWNKQLIKNTT